MGTENANPSSESAWLFPKDFDTKRYHNGTCQHCDRPCATGCECGAVLEPDAVHCPECGYIDFASLARDDCHRIQLATCSHHAAE